MLKTTSNSNLRNEAQRNKENAVLVLLLHYTIRVSYLNFA